MTYFKREMFSGIAPAVSPRLLAEQFGQVASDVDLESGRLVAVKEDADVIALQSGNRNSIYYYQDAHWLEWPQHNVSVAPGPIPGDIYGRLYFTGDDFPRIGTAASLISGSAGFPVNSFRLGVPAPSAAPTLTKAGAPDETQDPALVSYVYTLVTDLGEEGPPSAPSAAIDLTDTETVYLVLAASSLPSGEYNFGAGSKKRIYRSNTGSTRTMFQFVAEVLYTAESYIDTSDAATLGELLPSETWIGPPDDDVALYPDGPLQQLIPLAQGVMAGFTGKRFCVSEPYLPHAWPVAYRITTEEDIVAIASTANGVVALTDGRPYFITGTDPSAMTAIRVAIAQACVNKNSVVDMGSYVLYAGPDGLCAVQSSSGSVVTDGLISADQWRSDFRPTSIRAFKHEGTYVAFWTDGTSHGGWVYDPRGDENALTTLTTSDEVRGGHMNPKDGQLYIIVNDKIKAYRGGTARRNLTFKSKRFTTPAPISMAWLSISANEFPVTAKVFSDGVLIADYTISKDGGAYTQVTSVPANISNGTLNEPLMRVPAVLGTEWEIEVSGTDINSFCLAQSIDEVIGT